MKKKVIALALALAVALGCGAATAENVKHERVYVVTAADGTVRSITDSIRLENKDGLEVIRDRTMLRDIVNAGGSETFGLDGENLTWQANGNDIIYQGTSDKTPAVVPVVKLTLDGEELGAAELKERTGEAELTVTFLSSQPLPALAVCIMPLPAKGVSGLQLTNAAVLSEAGQQVLLGWAVPGAPEALKLPVSFSVRFHADHADLGWMMTFTTADPADMVRKELDKYIGFDLHAEAEDLRAIVTALAEGSEVPETTGKTSQAATKIRLLNQGLAQLDTNAEQLAESAGNLSGGADRLKTGIGTAKTGANALKEGAATLKTGTETAAGGMNELSTGLDALKANHETLNNGAEEILAMTLASANEQLAASGLAEAGITLPELTAENYAEVLDGAAAKPGIPPAAREKITALKEQLDRVSSFTQGLKSYTDGVTRAAESAGNLNKGMTQIKDGAAALADSAEELSAGIGELADGASTLSSGASKLYLGALALQAVGTRNLKDQILNAEKEAASALLPYLETGMAEALRLYDEAGSNPDAGGYDLRPEGMKTLTVYIIRTDLQ